MKACHLALALLLSAHAAGAQPGRMGLGIRSALDGAGFTAKYFVNRGYAIEGQLNVGGQRALNGSSIYACTMIEYHLDLPIPYLRLFFGGSLQVGYWTSRPDNEYVDEVMAGLSGVGGLECWLRRVPLAISGDLRPAINYLQEVEFFPHNMAGISLRYYFESDRVKPFIYPWRVRRKFR